VVLTLLVCDEVDLVGPLLEYYLAQGVDFFIVTASCACDPVLETVTEHVARGRATLIREEGREFEQSRWVTAMARAAATDHGADWVVNVDADEFFWPELGTLKETLAAVPQEYGALDVPVCHFVPRRDEDGFFADRLTVRETCSLKPSGRALFTKAVHRATPDVEVSMGNHRVSGTGLSVLRGWHPIRGLHFPVRTWDQFQERVERDQRGHPGLGMARYRERYELHRSGGLRDSYERKLMGDDEIEAGLHEGALVRDERLKRFFEHGGASEVAGFDLERGRELRSAAVRAAVEYERHPFALEIEKLKEDLEKARSGRSRGRRRLEAVERQRDEVKDELRAIRSTLPFRLGRRLESLRAAGPRRRGLRS